MSGQINLSTGLSLVMKYTMWIINCYFEDNIFDGLQSPSTY